VAKADLDLLPINLLTWGKRMFARAKWLPNMWRKSKEFQFRPALRLISCRSYEKSYRTPTADRPGWEESEVPG